MSCALLLPLAATLLCARPAPAAAPLELQSKTLADGSRLVVVSRPGEEQVSFRWLVGAGAAMDPPGKAGLAHALEHLVFHGTYETSGTELSQAARRKGATLNAYTMAQATLYVLDAPKAELEPLAGALLRTLSNPALTVARMGQEMGVVGTEAATTSSFGLKNQLDAMLFPSLDQTTSISGTKASRESLRTEDVQKFYASHYHASNTVALFVGDLTLEEAEKLVLGNSCLPPELPQVSSPRTAAFPRLPLEMKTRSMLTLSIWGYALDKPTPHQCELASGVLERRLRLALMVQDPVVSDLSVSCMRLRGNPFLLVLAYSTGLEASHLGDVLEKEFSTLAAEAPTAQEIKSSQKHRAAMEGSLLRSTSAIADAICLELADGERDLDAVRDWLFPRGKPSPAPCKELSERSFKEENRVQILFSPFHGEY